MKNASSRSFPLLLGGLILVIVVLLAIDTVVTKPQSSDMWPFAHARFGTISMTSSGGSQNYAYGSPATGMAVGEMARDSAFAPAPMPPVSVGGKTAAEAQPRVIKTADLEIDVDGVDTQTTAVAKIATDRGGFVQSSTVSEDVNGNKMGYVSVRVPADKFDESIAAIKELATRVQTESVQGQDVTEQYTDLQARLTSAQAQEAQYLEILKQAETVQDILAVQQYLENVRYEIESLQGQIQGLSNQTDYSTISVTLNEDVKVEVPSGKFDLARDAKTALKVVILLAQALLTFIVWFIIIGLAVAIPAGLFIALVVWVVRKIIARL